MGIKFYCPNGHKMNVKGFLAGQKGICPRCGVSVEIPLASVSKVPPPPAPASANPSAGVRPKTPVQPRTVFGLVVENPQPGGVAAKPAADQQPAGSLQPTTVPSETPTAAVPQPPEQQSTPSPLAEALQERFPTSAAWSLKIDPSAMEVLPEALPGAAYAGRTRRRSRKEQMATLSLFMLGVVAILTAILFVMFLTR